MAEQSRGNGPWAAPDDPRTRRQRPAWLPVLLVLLVVLAVAAPIALLSRADSRASAAGVQLLPVPRVLTPTPEPLAPAPGGQLPGGQLPGGQPPGGGAPSPGPSAPSGIPVTPPALARLGYRAVSIRTVSPEAVATDPGEVAEFRRDGLQSITAMDLVGVGRPGGDYLAEVYVLRFGDGASATRELAYSNTANRAHGYRDVPVLGVAGATGLTKTSVDGRPSVMDFVVDGSRQLFAGLQQVGGKPTVASVGAEAAKVLAALIPDSADIRPPDPGSGSGGQGGSGGPTPDPSVPTPEVPQLPSPTPTGQRA